MFMYPMRFVEGRMDKSSQSVDALKPGEGAVIELNGKRVAAFKDPAGKVILHTAVCSHLGCIVKWNSTEKTFDCPCHGSRYHADGSLLNGPAQRGLDPLK
jgi:Rieske Fe-S protein